MGLSSRPPWKQIIFITASQNSSGEDSAACGDQVRTWLWGWDLVKARIEIILHWASRLGWEQSFSLAVSSLWEGPISPIVLEEG